MDLAALRERATTTYRLRRDQAMDLVDRVPILGRLVNDFVRIEFIDRCMLIAAQGLLALVPMLVVLAAFFPHLIGDAVDSFTDAAGVGKDGTALIVGEVDDDVRSETGLVGLAITIFSATSFARAVQRMYERIWEQPHIGGISGARRCLTWLIGWLMTVQIIGGLRSMLGSIDGVVGAGIGLGVQCVALALLWWATSRWVLLFGRVAWHRLALGAALTGIIGVLYNRGSSFLMPPYVEANAQQFGTLGIILAISTWLIGFAAIMVGSALVGRVVSEDPTVTRVVSALVVAVRPLLPRRLRERGPADETAAPPAAG